MNLWLKDPKNGSKSVSLTLLVLSFVALLVASTFHLSGLVQNTSSLTELFGICTSLYFGRRWSNSKDGNSLEAPVTTAVQELTKEPIK